MDTDDLNLAKSHMQEAGLDRETIAVVLIDLLLTNINKKSPTFGADDVWRFVIGKGKVNKKMADPYDEH